MNPVDILAFGAHPDDVEIGAGGIIAKHTQAGYKVAICNLTEAELSSNGTVSNRYEEARNAATILGVEEVINLKIPDRGINNSYVDKIIEVIRCCKPKVVLVPYWEDRHPDHVECSKIVKEAIFDAAIHKKVVGSTLSHRVNRVSYYFLNDTASPDLIIDISEVYDKKMAALKAYSTQFNRTEGQVDTPINHVNFLEMIQGRNSMWGYQIGVRYGEALIHTSPLTQKWLYPF